MARRRKKARSKAAARTKQSGPEAFSNRPLAELERLAAERARRAEPTTDTPEQTSAPPAPARDRPDDDEHAFAEAMAGVRPLDRVPVAEPPEPRVATRPPGSVQEEAEVLAALQELVGGERSLSIHQTDESIEGLAEGIDPNLLRRLKRGEFSVQDHLDLHGTSREEARPIVIRFLTNAIAKGQRCVLIIHGRGHGSKDKIPVLKLALKSWLMRSGIRKAILAFSTALPCDGGGGAVYVLLRKRRGV